MVRDRPVLAETVEATPVPRATAVSAKLRERAKEALLVLQNRSSWRRGGCADWGGIDYRQFGRDVVAVTRG